MIAYFFGHSVYDYYIYEISLINLGRGFW